MKLKRELFKNEFFKNTLTLTIGTSIAQLVPVFFYPIIARIYTPSDFGLLAIIISIVSILGVVATGKYENSILITDTKKNTINIIALILVISFLVLFISFIGLWAFSSKISILFNEPLLKHWLLICPAISFAIIIYKVYNEWCVRNKYFKNLSYNKIVNASATTLGKFFLGILKASNGLIFGDALGRFVSAGSCIHGFTKRDREELKNISLKRMRVLAGKYIDFPKFSLPESLIDTVGEQLPVLLISYFFISDETGYFSMAQSVLFVPSSVISLAVMDVFRQRANEEWQINGNCLAIYKKTVKLMTLIVIPAGLILATIAPGLFSFVLGKEWRIAGEYAQIVLPNVAILFVFQVVSAVFIIANKLKVSFYWQIFSISLTLISLLIGGGIFKDMKMLLICYTAARIIANSIRFYLTYQYAKGA